MKTRIQINNIPDIVSEIDGYKAAGYTAPEIIRKALDLFRAWLETAEGERWTHTIDRQNRIYARQYVKRKREAET